jgi:hypothetical protein
MMKKQVLLFALLFSFITVTNSQTQTPLFKGIKSGMSPEEFTAYVSNNPEMELKIDSDNHLWAKTSFSGKEYFIGPNFSKNKLKSIQFFSFTHYKQTDYDPDILKKGEFYPWLKAEYGEPEVETWTDWEDLTEKDKLFSAFQKQNISAIITVVKTGEEYMVTLIIMDIFF